MKISLVIPVLNEEATVETFYRAVRDFSWRPTDVIELVFINDGSSDQTADIIESLASNDTHIVYIEFSRNFGKEYALMAGLEAASGDVMIPIDVDLQDPIDVIPEMIDKYEQGFDVVLAKRECRRQDGFLKRNSALWFYKLMRRISDSSIEENVGDFRLLSSRVAASLKQLPERNLFMKGILSWAGFSTTYVTYVRQSRTAGQSKFNGWKLWNFALEGITSFSTVPLRVWTYIGVAIAFLAFLYASLMIVQKLFWGNPIEGYPSLIVTILFLGGIQLVGIGILGEYIGRIYIETKGRPRYIVNRVIRNRAKKIPEEPDK